LFPGAVGIRIRDHRHRISGARADANSLSGNQILADSVHVRPAFAMIPGSSSAPADADGF
jgi:hypothetical protein